MESLRAERKAIVRSWYIVSSSVFSLAATQHQKQKQMKFPGAVIQIQSSLWLAEGPKRSRWIRNVRSGKTPIQFNRPPDCFSVWNNRKIRSNRRSGDRT